MKQTDDILTKIDRRTGMTVPDGYFEDFNRRMADMLPQQEWENKPAPRPLRVKLRPYLYMAAMFAGVWLMLHAVNIIKPSGEKSMMSDPVIAQAMDDDSFMADYYMGEFDDYDIVNEMIDNGTAGDFIASEVN